MATTDTTMYATAHQPDRDRVRYFPRQLITADDMRAEQDYFREKLRRHNRYLHGWGVVCGCEVKPNPTAGPWQVKVCPGFLITPKGDEVEIPKEGVNFDLAGDWRQPYDPCAAVSPCQPTSARTATDQSQTIYLAVCYTECNTRPVRIHPAGCGCDEAACEYSRIRDSFELVRLTELPESHKQVPTRDQDWYTTYQNWLTDPAESARPVSKCPEDYDDNCVVLACIRLPKERNTQIGTGGTTQIHHEVGRDPSTMGEADIETQRSTRSRRSEEVDPQSSRRSRRGRG